MNLAMVSYPFTPILKYIPLRYDNLEHWQKAEQMSVFKFSKGIINHKNLQKLTDTIYEIVKDRRHGGLPAPQGVFAGQLSLAAV